MTLGECIHGLDVPVCDICFPRREPVPVKPPRLDAPRRAPRTDRTRTDRARPDRVRPERTAPAPRIDLDGHRVQHVTPLANLESILAEGALVAGAQPPIDLSSATVRELRATTELPGGDSVAERVPFYLSAGANPWLQLRAGALGPHWSDAARAIRPGDLVALVAAIGALDDAVLTDGDAAATTTRFVPVSDRRAAEQLLGRLSADGGRLDDAELLGPARVPLEGLSLVVVATEPIRDRVRDLLADAGVRVRVAVNPPWFAVP